MSPADVRTEAFRYRLPLARPLVMPSGTYTEREGILLRLTTADGVVGWGEAAPLPGYSPDTLDDAATWLGAWAAGRPTAVAISSLDDVPAARRLAAALPTHSPAALWATVQADADIEAQRTGRSLAQVYTSRGPRRPPVETVSLNALLLGRWDAASDAAGQAVADGYRAAKLKVGGLAPNDAAALAREVAGALGDVSLRLDANGAWSLADAVVFADALDGVSVEYVEEPLANVEDLPTLASRSAVRWALDESLRQAFASPELVAVASAAVVKPSLGPEIVWSASFEFERHPIRERTGPVVISSMFESGVGMRHLVALAAAFGDTPAGLDTYRWLAEDVLDHPLPIAGPSVDVAAVLAPNPVRVDRLEPLAL